MSKVIIVFGAALVIAVGALILSSSGGGGSELDGFAQCLASKGATMYGAAWCSHCESEKKAFGKSFRFISYVECPDEPQRCIVAGVESYPTWIFSDGKKLVGEQGLLKLSQESGCELPQASAAGR